MAENAYDCIVIGSGPGGYVAAIRAAQLGMKTAVAEKDVVGGRCLNYACIPAKAVLRVADVATEIREAADFGIKVGEPEIDYAAVNARREKVIKTLTGGVAGLFKKNKIDYIEGFGALANGGVKIGDTEYSAKTVVIACGSVRKPLPGIDYGGRVIGTEEAWALPELPSSIAVIGAGASGTEIASAYARMGVETHLFEALDRVLPTEDADISKVAGRVFGKQGIKVHTKTLIEGVESSDSSVSFAFGDEKLTVDWLVIAAGRGPDVEGLGLDTAGIELTENGLIRVDGAQRTSKAGVYAIGDLVPGPGAGAQGVRRGDHRRRGRGREQDSRPGARGHPAGDVLHADRRLLRADRAAGARPGPRRRRRQGRLRRRRCRHRLRRPHRAGQDRRREEVRRAAGRPHRRRQVDRADPGARQRARARGRLLRGGADGPRPPDARRGSDGGRARRRRVADPRVRLARLGPPEQPVFYFDFGSAESYLAAERVLALLHAEWVPVRRGELLGAGVDELAAAEVERRARERGLQPLRWPERAPRTDLALRAATYAKQGGRTVQFSLAAFRQAFAGGRDLDDENTVVIAGAACELHPRALLVGIASRGVAQRLAAQTEGALAAGVRDVPAVLVGERVFHGDDGLEEAAAACAPSRPST